LVLVDKWKMPSGITPNGFAFDQLMTDVKARADAQSPDPLAALLL